MCVGEAEMGGAINPFTECRMGGESVGSLPLSLHLPFWMKTASLNVNECSLCVVKARLREGRAQNNLIFPLLLQISRPL